MDSICTPPPYTYTYPYTCCILVCISCRQGDQMLSDIRICTARECFYHAPQALACVQSTWLGAAASFINTTDVSDTPAHAHLYSTVHTAHTCTPVQYSTYSTHMHTCTVQYIQHTHAHLYSTVHTAHTCTPVQYSTYSTHMHSIGSTHSQQIHTRIDQSCYRSRGHSGPPWPRPLPIRWSSKAGSLSATRLRRMVA